MKDDLSKILSAIGRKVNFIYPEGEGKKQGVLKDRVVVKSTNKHLKVPYWNIVDLIEFEGESELRIRIGYYRKRRNSPSPKYASQTTITEPIHVWKELLVKAAQDKEWFRDLLEDVMRELKTRKAVRR
jgi:hypothetical protein